MVFQCVLNEARAQRNLNIYPVIMVKVIQSKNIFYYFLLYSREEKKTEKILTKVSCERCWTELTQFDLRVESFSSIVEIEIANGIIEYVTNAMVQRQTSIDSHNSFDSFDSMQYWKKPIFYLCDLVFGELGFCTPKRSIAVEIIKSHSYMSSTINCMGISQLFMQQMYVQIPDAQNTSENKASMIDRVQAIITITVFGRFGFFIIYLQFTEWIFLMVYWAAKNRFTFYIHPKIWDFKNLV